MVGVIRLSRAAYRKMLQNLAWGAGYNLVAIPLAAGVFAWAGITLSPAVGAVLMSASTVVVALNAQLLRRLDLRRELGWRTHEIQKILQGPSLRQQRCCSYRLRRWAAGECRPRDRVEVAMVDNSFEPAASRLPG